MVSDAIFAFAILGVAFWRMLAVPFAGRAVILSMRRSSPVRKLTPGSIFGSVSLVRAERVPVVSSLRVSVSATAVGGSLVQIVSTVTSAMLDTAPDPSVTL